MAFYNLPPVTLQGLPEPKTHGEWFSVSSLDALARSLRLDNAPVRTDELKSIPDAWAQAQLSTDAFFDQDHDAHEDVVAQWRGLLALFALQPIYNAEYDLNVHSIDLQDKGRGSKLRAVLQSLMPTPSASLGLPWDKLGVVEIIERSTPLEHKAIALLSPATLLAPGRSSAKFKVSSIPWLANGLSDPTVSGNLKPEAWEILAAYISGLIEGIRAHNATDQVDADRDKLVAQLNSYLQACRAHQSSGLPAKAHILRLEWPHPFFALLARTQVVDSDAIGDVQSDCEVSLRPGRPANLFNRALLADPDIAKTLGRALQGVRLWKHYTLQDAASASTLAKIRAEAASEGCWIIEKEELFCSQLVDLEDDAEVLGNPSSLQHSLLPLSPLALMLDGWNNNPQLERRGNTATFSIDLILQAEGQHHTVCRTYQANQIVAAPAPVDLAIWPSFSAIDWPWTFFRFQNDPRNELITRFAVSGELIAAHIDSADKNVLAKRLNDWGSASSLSIDKVVRNGEISQLKSDDSQLLLERFLFEDKAHLVGEQHRLPLGVEAIFFAIRDETTKRDLPTGCVVVRREEAPESSTRAVAAFDFGTTNTVSYTRKGRQTARCVTFEDRVLLPVSSKRGKQAVAAAYTDFFPVGKHKTPVPTIAKKREFGQGALPKDIRSALNNNDDVFGLSHMVFFMPQGALEEQPNVIINYIDAGLLEFDIKWGEGAAGRMLVQSFLRQLMIMVAAELRSDGVALADISWRYSFPQAFSTTHKTAFQNIIRNAWDSLVHDKQDVVDADDALKFTTEAEAAMRYFTMDPEQEKYGVGRLVVMFDIGGGTTDIAIWKEKALLWRGSVRLAGSHFFNNYIQENLSLLRAIDKDAVKAYMESNKAEDGDDRYRARQFVELMVAKPDFTERFSKAYPLHSGEPEWAGLRQVAITALAGLHSYVGLVLSKLRSEGKITDLDLKELTVAMGGRGSTIFRQFNSGVDASELASVCRLVAEGIRSEGGEMTATIEPRFSGMPKEEVARGLLLDEPTDAPALDRALFEPSGLTLTGKVEGEAKVVLPADDMRKVSSAFVVDEVSLDGLNEFLDRLAASTGISIRIEGKSAENTIQLRTRSHLAECLQKAQSQRDEATDTQDVEAPFITALRNLVAIMCYETEDRDKALAVTERSS